MYILKTESINGAFRSSLKILLREGLPVSLDSEAQKGSHSSGGTLELHNLLIEITVPNPYEIIQVKPSKVAEKFIDGMLLKDMCNIQAKRIVEQRSSIITRLKQKQETRRAVIGVWEPEDLFGDYAPCIVLMQFLVREGKLFQTVMYRSHDMWNAFLWNSRGNIMFQDNIAKELKLKIGTYTELAVSAHIYDVDKEKIKTFIYPKNNIINRDDESNK